VSSPHPWWRSVISQSITGYSAFRATRRRLTPRTSVRGIPSWRALRGALDCSYSVFREWRCRASTSLENSIASTSI